MATFVFSFVATTTNPFYTTAEISKQLTTSKAKLFILGPQVAKESEVLEAEITKEDEVAPPFSLGKTVLTKGVVTSVAQQVDRENLNL
ncbi:putative 4-coumarate--CoA ligase 2-like [Sesbania bispinosa]|nr:putative 4-coumarate--CoA ligase 2-like [Sesbania bispinosa]